MKKKNNGYFDIKKLEEGIEKLKLKNKLPDNFKLKGVCKTFAWGEMSKLCDGIMQDLVILWYPSGMAAMGIKGESTEQLIYDDNNDIVLGQAQRCKFDLDRIFDLGDLSNS